MQFWIRDFLIDLKTQISVLPISRISSFGVAKVNFLSERTLSCIVYTTVPLLASSSW
jgi:hypothetical protein